MKSINHAVTSLAAIVLALFLTAPCYGQTNDDALQPLAPSDIPDSGSFFLLSDYLTNGGSLGAPWPFLKDTNAVVYSINGSSFLVDDTAMTNDQEALNALALLLQPQDTFSADMLSGSGRFMAMDDVDADPNDGSDTNSGDGGSFSPQFATFSTNGLWIYVPTNSTAVTNQFSCVLENTEEDQEYDVLTSTNLAAPLSQWAVEQSVFGVEGTNCTPVTLLMNNRSNLFVWVHFGGSTDGSGLPDWWEQQYFPGVTNGIDPYAKDSSGDGWSRLDYFLKNWIPGTWHTPPPPQNFSVYLDSTGTNEVMTWQYGGGPIDHYEIESGGDNAPSVIGEVNNTTFSFIDNDSSDLVSPTPHRVVAVLADGTRIPGSWAWPPLDRSAYVFRGSNGQFYLAIMNVPQNLIGLNLNWSSGSEYVDATNVVGGILQFPQSDQLAIAQGDNSLILQLVDSDMRQGDIIYPIFAMYPEHQLGIPTAVTNFANASTHMKENLRFLFRSAGALWPFAYSSGITFDLNSFDADQGQPFPTNVYSPEIHLARGPSTGAYEYYGYHTFSPNLNFFCMDELRPVYENFLWRNFVYNPADFPDGTPDTGVTWDYLPNGAAFPELDPAKYQYSGPGTETSLPLAFNLSTAGWLYFATALGDDPANANLGISESGTSPDFILTLTNNLTNIYGLNLQSAYGNTNFFTLGSSFPFTGLEFPMYENFAAPDLQIVDYFFGSQTPFFNYIAGYENAYPHESLTPYTGAPPALPGSPSFSTTNTSPLLFTGIGQPFTVSGWAKMAIANGNTNKFGYLEQYFDFGQAYAVGTNGIATTNSASVGPLSPYGDFFPTMPGPAALVTMPDIDTGQRATSVVNVVKLQLDVNHDGTMDLSFGGPDNTSQARPFEFWINNDNDGTGVGTDSDPEGNTNLMDYSFNQIRSWRNLEDFARMWICGVPATGISQPPFTVYLSWRNTAGNPAINLYLSCETNGGIGYLTDTNIAKKQTENDLLSPYGGSIGTVSTNSLFVFPDTTFVFGRIQYLLFEGASAGSGELVMTVADGTNILAQTSQWIDLHDIKDFYERTVITNNTTGTPSTWTSAIETNVAATSSGLGDDTNLIILVHGINVSFSDWLIEGATVFKRLYWSGYYGKFAAVKWPCEFFRPWTLISVDTSVFNRSEMKAYVASTSMKTYLDQLHDRFPGYQVNLFVHSQGNAVVSEAINEGGTFDTYILTEGALPASAYDAAAPLDPGLTNIQATTPTPEWQPMGYHGMYTNMTGRVVNFFNTNDPVTGVWVDDQVAAKPDSLILWEAWQMTHNIIPPPPSSWYQYDPVSSNSTFETFTGIGEYTVTDPEESRAFVSRSLTQPIGRNPPETAHGVIKSGIDMTAHFGFGNAFPDDHSAQWVRPIQTTRPYYQQILTSCQIIPAP